MCEECSYSTKVFFFFSYSGSAIFELQCLEGKQNIIFLCSFLLILDLIIYKYKHSMPVTCSRPGFECFYLECNNFKLL